MPYAQHSNRLAGPQENRRVSNLRFQIPGGTNKQECLYISAQNQVLLCRITWLPLWNGSAYCGADHRKPRGFALCLQASTREESPTAKEAPGSVQAIEQSPHMIITTNLDTRSGIVRCILHDM